LFNLLDAANGYAHAYTRHPFNGSYMEVFIECGRQAGLEKRGLWSEEEFASVTAEPPYNPIVYITNTGEKYHQYHCQCLLESRIPIRLSEAVYLGLSRAAFAGRLSCLWSTEAESFFYRELAVYTERKDCSCRDQN